MAYETMRRTLTNLLDDMAILAGDRIADVPSTRDVIGTAKTNAASLARQLDAMYDGAAPYDVFPSPSECLAAGDADDA